MITLRGNERLLILKMSSIGDVVHALPAASALRRTYPKLRISWLIEESLAALVRDHQAVDRVVAIPSVTRGRMADRRAALRIATERLRTERYDLALDLQGLLVSSLLGLLARAPVRVGRPRRREGAPLVTRRIRIPKGVHAIEENLACAYFLGARPGPVRFDLAVPEATRAAVTQRLSLLRTPPSGPLIVINPSTSTAWKRWPAANWVTAAQELASQASIVLIGTQEQRALHDEIARQVGKKVYDLTGETSLAELIALLDRCTIHVAGDTGSTHIAAALGRPVVAIYGVSDPVRLAPYGQEHHLLSGVSLCRPMCPHWCATAQRCLRSITPDRVVDQARRAMAAERDQRSAAGGPLSAS
jgi:heptosyltransferase I